MMLKAILLYSFASLVQLPYPVLTYCNSGLQEGSGDQLSCGPDQYLLFTCGVYYGTAWYCSGYRTITSTLNTRCDHQSTCTIRASNDWFGDPCWGSDKVLEYTHICRDSWTPWRWDCPVSCNGENITRIRSCVDPKGCTESSVELIDCLLLNCSRDGDWGAWGDWSSCPLSCDGQNISRTRSCDSPSALNGGKECMGTDEETIDCLVHGCARDGDWSEWTIWSDCPVNCLNQSVTRNRTCDRPAPSNNGSWCHGNDTEWTSCVQAGCPVNGNWSKWSQWENCPAVCERGTFIRTRTCDNPAAINNGTNCTGDPIEIQGCDVIGCTSDDTTFQSSEEHLYYYIAGGAGSVALLITISVVVIIVYYTQKSSKRLTKVHPFHNAGV